MALWNSLWLKLRTVLCPAPTTDSTVGFFLFKRKVIIIIHVLLSLTTLWDALEHTEVPAALVPPIMVFPMHRRKKRVSGQGKEIWCGVQQCLSARLSCVVLWWLPFPRLHAGLCAPVTGALTKSRSVGLVKKACACLQKCFVMTERVTGKKNRGKEIKVRGQNKNVEKRSLTSQGRRAGIKRQNVKATLLA